MLRAGICDLRTCDLEMGCTAGPAGPSPGPRCGPSGPPHVLSGPPGKNGQSRHAPPARRPACARRLVWPASDAFRLEDADLLLYRLADDDLPHLPPLRDTFPAGMPPICGRDAARFRPRETWRFHPAGNARFPGLPWRFRRDTRRFRRTAGTGGHAFPARPSLRARYRSPPPASSRAHDPFPGRPPGTRIR
jgi:hypothetical protein